MKLVFSRFLTLVARFYVNRVDFFCIAPHTHKIKKSRVSYI